MGKHTLCEELEARADDVLEESGFEEALHDVTRREPFLLDEVRTADLTKYADHQLQNRLAQYERDYTFERDLVLRAEFKREVERTKIELRRRNLYKRAEADRVFEL